MARRTTAEPAARYADLLDPRGEVETVRDPIAERLDDLEGATVGFLDNSKTNADRFLDEVAAVLTDAHGVAATVHRRKDKSPIPAGDVAESLAADCDAVVNAYGDCGSCTSWCVYDSIDLERRDVPVATINSEEFVRLGQSEARSLGMPGLPLVTVAHPMGDADEATVRRRARGAVEEIVAVLTTDRERLEAEYRDRFLDADEELSSRDLACPL